MRVEKSNMSTCRSLPGSNRSFSYSKKGRRSAILIAGFRLGRQDCPAVPTADGPPENLKWTRLVVLVKRHADIRSEDYAGTQEISESEFVPLPLSLFLVRPGAGVLLHYMSFVLTGQQKCKCRDCYTIGLLTTLFFRKKNKPKK